MVAAIEPKPIISSEQKLQFQQLRKAELKLNETEAADMEGLKDRGWFFQVDTEGKWIASRGSEHVSSFNNSLPIAISNALELESEMKKLRTGERQPASFREIPVSQIVPSPFQLRKNFEDSALQELAESIKAKGVLEPILVRPREAGFTVRPPSNGSSLWYVRNRHGVTMSPCETEADAIEEVRRFNTSFELVAGERRWRASKLAGLSTIPAIVRELSDKEAAEIGAIENLQRKDLDPIEEAEGFKMLIEGHGYTPESLAEKLSKSKSYIYGVVKLCGLPEVARAAVCAGTLPISTAQLIGRIPNEKLRAKAAAEIVTPQYSPDEPLSFRQAKQKIENFFMKELKGSPFDKSDAKLLPEAGACITCPKLTGNNREEFPDGRADMCTDPGCFAKKISAHEQNRVETLKRKGIETLSKSVVNDVLDYYGERVQSNRGYFELSAVCADDSEGRTFKQLLGSAAKQYAATKNNKTHYLVKFDEVAETLKLNHGIELKAGKMSSGGGGSNADYKAQQAAREKKEMIDKAALGPTIDRLVMENFLLLKLMPADFFRLIILRSLDLLDDLSGLASRRGLTFDPKKYDGAEKAIESHIKELDALGLQAFLVELYVWGSFEFYLGAPNPELQKIFDTYGIDWKLQRKAAETALKAEEKSQAKPAKAKKGK